MTGMIRIGLTFGPGAVKTTVADALADAPAHGRLAKKRSAPSALVPEAATQVYAARRTRWDRLDESRRRDVQREIYHFQRVQEECFAAEVYAAGRRVLLLDRGTLDGAAYWPDGPDDYWRVLGTSEQTELSRYDAVLVLESAAALGMPPLRR